MVNGIGFFPSPTLNDVRLQAQGTDASVGLRIATQGSGILGFYSNSTSNILATFNPVTSSVNYLQFNPSITGNPVSIQSAGPDTSIGLTLLSKGAGGGITLTAGASSNMLFTAGAYQFVGSPVFFRDGNNNTTLQLAQVASAVNAIQISPSAAGGALAIGAVGADASINLNIQPKGTGAFQVVIPGATGNSLTVTGPAVPADGVTVTAAATANPATVSLSATGSDANINLNLISKGTGVVQANGLGLQTSPQLPYLPATSANIPATAGATLTRVDGTSETWYILTYPKSGTPEATFEIPARAFSNVRITWRTTAITGACRWLIEVREKGAADVLGGGTVIVTTVSNATAAATTLQFTESTIPMAYTPGANKRTALLRILRDSTNVGDTLTVGADILYVELT
jgi:hypothetical protein